MVLSNLAIMYIFLPIVAFLSLFVISALKGIVVSALIITAGAGMGLLYAYMSNFMRNVGIQYKLRDGAVLLSISVLYLYSVHLAQIEFLSILSMGMIPGAFRLYAGPALNVIDVIILYPVSFILAFYLYLRNKQR